MKVSIAVSLAALALTAACQQAPEGENPDADGAETAIPVEPDGGIGDGAAAPPGTDATDQATILSAFQGRWGMTTNDCDPAQADIAKGLMVVTATKLEFYESVGTLDEVEEASANRFSANFDFEGEGMEWERDMTMDLQDNGQTLVRREAGEAAMPQPLRYTRCAA